jgi:hypothetical protein
MPDDWKDVVLHVLAAAVIIGVIGLTLRGLSWDAAIWVVAGINAVWWPVREWRQDVVEGKPWYRQWPMRSSVQKTWEAVAPAVTGVVVAAIIWFGAM